MIVLDTETANMPENTDEKILCQLAWYNTDRDLKYLTYHKPETEISIEAMEIHGITPDKIEEDYSKEKEAFTFKELNKLNKEETIVIGHNINFDFTVLEREGYLNHMTVIDTFKIAMFINDANKCTLWKSTRLSYLKYYYRLDKLNDNNKSHDAMSDVIDTYNLWLKFKEEFNITEQQAITLCSSPIFLEHCPFGKNVGTRWVDMSYNQLKYYNDMGNVDVSYSINKLKLI